MGLKKSRFFRDLQRSKLPTFRWLRFFLKLNFFAIPLYLFLVLHIELGLLQQLTADAVVHILTAAGAGPLQQGLFISIPISEGSWGAFITWDCVGWKSMLAFLALVAATDEPLRKKIYGILLIPFILVVNIFRIVFLFLFVQRGGLESYTLVHEMLWSWGLLAIVLVLWFLWFRFGGFREKSL